MFGHPSISDTGIHRTSVCFHCFYVSLCNGNQFPLGWLYIQGYPPFFYITFVKNHAVVAETFFTFLVYITTSTNVAIWKMCRSLPTTALSFLAGLIFSTSASFKDDITSSSSDKSLFLSNFSNTSLMRCCRLMTKSWCSNSIIFNFRFSITLFRAVIVDSWDSKIS